MGPKYNRVQCNGNCTTTRPAVTSLEMQLSLTARAIFSGVRGEGRRGRLRSLEGGGGRGASCISRELGCNNYYLSRFLARPLSCVPTIILVRTTPRPSAGTLPPSLPLPLRCASQIELISGIYRAADFPFVLSLTRPTEYTSDGISLSAWRICTAYNAPYVLRTRLVGRE